jgi:uncharacterized membrane protein YjfL (UPF0719 family)
MPEQFMTFLQQVGSTIVWSIIAVVIAGVVFELLEKRYKLIDEIFKENSTAAAVFAGSIVLGIFYTVAQIATH